MTIKFKKWDCKITVAYYSPGPTGDAKARKAIMLLDIRNDQLVAVATVNMPGYPCEENQVYVKNYSENRGMLQTLIDNKIVSPDPVSKLDSDYVTIPLMQLTPEAMKLWEKKPVKNEK